MPEIYLDLKANLQKQTIFHPLLNLVIACSEKEKLNQQQQDHARAGHICEDNYLRVHARLRKKNKSILLRNDPSNYKTTSNGY